MTVGRIAFGPLFHQTLGFENFLRDVEKMLGEEVKPSTFPHHNIIKVDDSRYIVELAVAGFSKDEIEITRQEGSLKIVGMKQNEDMGQAKPKRIEIGSELKFFEPTLLQENKKEVKAA